MVQFYTLEEAAARLQLTPEQLREMAKKNEIRAFQDRGKLRFRVSEIEELARSRGLGSDPELQFGDKKTSEPKSGPKSGGPRSPSPKTAMPKPGKPTQYVTPPSDADVKLPLDPTSEEVPLGQDPASAASGSKNTPRNTNTRSPSPKRAASAPPPSPSPRPRPGSDSDVRLVGEGSDLQFQIDSDAKLEKSPAPGPKTPGSGRKHTSTVELGGDSGVRIVPLSDASDSDVKIVPEDPDSKVGLGQAKNKTPSDSDIRLEGLHTDSGKTKQRDEKHHITEEIDVDAEDLKAAKEEAAKKKAKPKPREGSTGQLPTTSPFELSSDPDMKVEAKPEPKAQAKPEPKTSARRPSKADSDKKKSSTEDSSSDFELSAMKEGSSPLDLGSDEMTPIKLDDSDEEEVGLGELTTGTSGGTSGINLKDPVDSGISLEEGGSDEMDIEESIAAGNTPKPSPKVDSSSEFELSLDDSDAEEEGSSSEFELTLDEPSSPTEEGSSSEFELSLDPDDSSSVEMESTEQASDSEFELTIDEAGGLDLEEEDKDIFAHTDFDVPALDEESGSEAVALDEDSSESSDFDLDVDEDVDTEAESGSEVVALDEDEEIAPRAKKKGGRTAVAEEEEEQEPGDFADLEEDAEPELEEEPEPEEELEEEEAEEAAPARRSWGIFAPVCATVTAFILFFVVLMSYEMVQSMWGYHRSTKTSSLIVDPLARSLFGSDFPKE